MIETYGYCEAEREAGGALAAPAARGKTFIPRLGKDLRGRGWQD